MGITDYMSGLDIGNSFYVAQGLVNPNPGASDGYGWAYWTQISFTAAGVAALSLMLSEQSLATALEAAYSVLRDQVFVLDHLYMSLFSTCGWLLRLAATLVLLTTISPALRPRCGFNSTRGFQISKVSELPKNRASDSSWPHCRRVLVSTMRPVLS